MKRLLLLIIAALIALPVSPFVLATVLYVTSQYAHGAVDYTGRTLRIDACGLFAMDVIKATDHRAAGADMELLIKSIQSQNVAESMKERAFQAVQFAWAHELVDTQLAYTLAMGACLEPRTEMAPMMEPWRTNLRTFKNAL